jgi:phage/plasmid-like protein (TIGR03299 family)
MNHQLETHRDQAAFYSAVEDAWHRLGTVTREAQDAEQALKIAHLDWPVRKVPLFTGSGLEVPGRYATVRTNPFTGEDDVLGVVGERYEVVQNMDNCRFLDAVAGESGSVFETAGSLHRGRKIFVSMKAPKTMRIGGHDNVDFYLLATNTHDGSAPVRLTATPIRVVCANTERQAILSALSTYTIKHSGDINAKVDEAQEAMNVMWDFSDEFEGWANHLYQQEFDYAAFNDFVENEVFPEPKGEESDLVRDRRMARQGSLVHLWKDSHTMEGIRGTKWGAYNAITEWFDWRLPAKSDAKRLERIADDATLDKKVSALVAAL